MVKVCYGKEQFEAIKRFEEQHHPDIWKWIMDKVGSAENLDVLDVSEEACVFAITLAQNHPSVKLTIAARGDKPGFDLPPNVTFKRVDFRRNYDDISNTCSSVRLKHRRWIAFCGEYQIGTFDLIIVNEITHEIADFVVYYNKLKTLLKKNAPIVVLARPKNPPLPIPECCLMLWNKLAPTREALQQAAQVANLNSTCFSAAVPVTVDKFEWEKILCSGCFPAVRNTPKCGEREIRDYCNNKSQKLSFEEKLTLFLLRNP